MDYYLLGKTPAIEPAAVAEPLPASATGTTTTSEEEFHD
jgi:penicillin-binding protein 2